MGKGGRGNERDEGKRDAVRRAREKEDKKGRCIRRERERERKVEGWNRDGKRSERRRAGIIVYSVGITMAGPGLQIY